MANEILIKFKAEGNQAVVGAINQLHLAQTKLEKGQKAYEEALRKVKKEQDATGKGMFDLSNKGRLLQNSFATIRSKMLLAAFAAGLVQKSILSLVNLYAEQELAQRRLTIALGHTSKRLVDQASALQKVTKFGDEAIIRAQALVATFVKEESQVAKVTESVLDLASAKGMDLNTAADLVARSIGSSTNALSRYGIEAEGSAGSTERLESIVDNIQKTFGGFARGELETVSGMLAATANAVGDAGEAFGEVLAPAVIAVAQAIKTMAELINPERIKSWGLAMLLVAGATGKLTAAFKTLRATIILTNVQVDLLRAKLLKSGLGIAVLAVGELAYQLGLFEDSAANAGATFANVFRIVKEEIQEAEEATRTFNRAILDNIYVLDNQLVLTRKKINDGKELTLQNKQEIAQYQAYIKLGRTLVKEEKQNINEIVKLIHENDERIKQERETLSLLNQKISLTLKSANATASASDKDKAAIAVEKNRLNLIQSLIKEMPTLFSHIEEFPDHLTDSLMVTMEELTSLNDFSIGDLGLSDVSAAEKIVFDLLVNIASENEKIIAANKERKEAAEELAATQLNSSVAQLEIDKQILESQEAGRQGMLAVHELELDKIKSKEDLANATLTGVELEERLLELELEGLELTNRKAAAEKAFQKIRNDGYVNAAKNILILGRELTKNKEQQKNINFALAMIDAYRAAVTTRKNLLDAGLVPPLPGIFAGIEFAAAAAQANNIRKMEEGGLIGGKRHSQGGTIIEAERGEFIMSRRAVESIGLGVLSTMNQGGGAINVNVTGNVLSSDFVEGELADKISEAVRKGVDFGMS